MKSLLLHLLRFLFLFILFFLCAPRLLAGTVDFEWDPNPATDNVTAYILNARLPDGTVRKIAEVDSKTTTASGDFAAGRHTVFVVARAGTILSDPSDPITFTVPGKPGAPRIRVSLQTSADLAAWETVSVYYDAATSRKYYRATIEPLP